eukprot:maker-scaffold595_size129005-snap-gene-0.19 protein:Tk09127 transcript:maker-scaffold595_size129005-snap-gene-0.19-mRNA-1 annotation:"glutamic acid-rich protein"
MQAAEAYTASARAARKGRAPSRPQSRQSPTTPTGRGTWSARTSRERAPLTPETYSNSYTGVRTASASPGPNRRQRKTSSSSSASTKPRTAASLSTQSTPSKKPDGSARRSSREVLNEIEADDDLILKRMEEILMTYKSKVEDHLAAEGRELPKEIFEDFTTQWVNEASSLASTSSKSRGYSPTPAWEASRSTTPVIRTLPTWRKEFREVLTMTLRKRRQGEACSTSSSSSASPTVKKRRNTVDPPNGSDSDLDLSKELHPIGHFVNDREAMLNQVLSVVQGAKFRAMLTTTLKHIEFEELKAMFLEQLEGMSKKRIKYVLAGQRMDESSNTEDEDEDEEPLREPEPPIANPIPTVERVPEPPIETTRRVSSPEEKVDANGFLKGKKKILPSLDVSRKKGVSLNFGTDKMVNPPSVQAKSTPTQNPDAPPGKTKMELLELEMRARAIKALLKKAGDPQGNEKRGEMGHESKSMKPEGVVKSENKIEIQKLVQEEKRLIRARDMLMVSESKKKEEKEALEMKEQELKRRLEEHQKKREEEKEKERKLLELEEEKKRKKIQREEEYIKFAKWKEEKRKEKEDQRRREEERERKIKERKTQAKLKQMKTDMNQKHAPKESVALKKKKIHREDVGDFDITLDYSSFEEEDPRDVTSAKRRYRNKIHPKEEGEASDVSAPPPNLDHAHSPLSLSSLSSEDEAGHRLEKIRQDRLERFREIKEARRKKKPANEIEDGEVDSDGEHFEPVTAKTEGLDEDSADPEESLAKYDLNPCRKSTKDRKSDVVKAPEKLRKHDHVFIEDDSDNERILSSDEESDRQPPITQSQTRESPKRAQESNEELDEEEKEEAKTRLDTMEKRRQDRIKRMQAFQAKTDIDPRALEVESDHEDDCNYETKNSDTDQPKTSDPNASDGMECSEVNTIKDDADSMTKYMDAGIKIEYVEPKIKMTDVDGQVNAMNNEVNVDEESPDTITCKEPPEGTEETLPSLNILEVESTESMKEGSGPKDKSNPESVAIGEKMDSALGGEAFEGQEESKAGNVKANEATNTEKVSGDFYQSYFEDEHQKQEVEEKRRMKEEEAKTEEEAKAKRLEEGKRRKDVKRKMKEAESLKSGPDLAAEPQTSIEEKKMAGVGYWKEQVESHPELVADPPEVKEKPKTKASSQDLPNKAEVDQQQEELESLTWADRWYQNKKVQKVVKDSKMMSKVRTQIKLKEFKLPPTEGPSSNADNAPKVEDLPNVIGSMEEYATLMGKNASEDPSEGAESKQDEGDEEESDENDELWGSIMGGQ